MIQANIPTDARTNIESRTDVIGTDTDRSDDSDLLVYVPRSAHSTIDGIQADYNVVEVVDGGDPSFPNIVLKIELGDTTPDARTNIESRTDVIGTDTDRSDDADLLVYVPRRARATIAGIRSDYDVVEIVDGGDRDFPNIVLKVAL